MEPEYDKTIKIRVATAARSGKRQRNLIFFKVREKSGNFANWSGKFKYQESHGKVRESHNFGPQIFWLQEVLCSF